MSTERTPHILNAASNLLGITLVIISGLNITNQARKTFADQIAWGAAACFAVSCLLSYLALRTSAEWRMASRWADRAFLAGLLAVFVAVVALALSDLR